MFYPNQAFKSAKPTLSSSILVMYPHLHQSEWVPPLVHSQHKLDSVVGGGAQGQQKNIQHQWRLQMKN